MHFWQRNTVTNDYYPLLAQKLFELAVRLKEEVGVHIGFINLSGGVGILIARIRSQMTSA